MVVHEQDIKDLSVVLDGLHDKGKVSTRRKALGFREVKAVAYDPERMVADVKDFWNCTVGTCNDHQQRFEEENAYERVKTHNHHYNNGVYAPSYHSNISLKKRISRQVGPISVAVQKSNSFLYSERFKTPITEAKGELAVPRSVHSARAVGIADRDRYPKALKDEFVYNLIRENLTDVYDLTTLSVSEASEKTFPEHFDKCPLTLKEFCELSFVTFVDHDTGTIFWFAAGKYLVEKQFQARVNDEPWHVASYEVVSKHSLEGEVGWKMSIQSEEGLLQTVNFVVEETSNRKNSTSIMNTGLKMTPNSTLHLEIPTREGLRRLNGYQPSRANLATSRIYEKIQVLDLAAVVCNTFCLLFTLTQKSCSFNKVCPFSAHNVACCFASTFERP